MASADFTIADVLEWARTKPAEERYSFCDSSLCALAQFGMATSREYLVGSKGTKLLREWPALLDALNHGMGYTFGALVTRLEALVPAPVTKSMWTRADAYLTDIELASA